MANSNNRGGVLCNTSQCSLLVTRLFYTQTLCQIVEALKKTFSGLLSPSRALQDRQGATGVVEAQQQQHMASLAL